jgi:hypothetical protein
MSLPVGSSLERQDYVDFLSVAHGLLRRHGQYFAPDEGLDSLELAHLIPEARETVLAIYVGINDAVCNKGLVTPFLPRHSHNNVFVFEPDVFPGGEHVPDGTVDARSVVNGFLPPNETWHADWTYVMIDDPTRSFGSLWKEKGYIDMIPAKYEDFTMLSDASRSRVCTFVDPKAFEHPVNRNRPYLKAARDRGARCASEFAVPEPLAPVVLDRGEKLYVATPGSGPCAHCWSNIHPDNEELAVVNENSAIPLALVIAKPPLRPQHAASLVPATGSADMTTDWFFRGKELYRRPILQGGIQG